MPELPEVETVVRTLQHKIDGRKITGVRVLWPNLIAHPDCHSFESQLAGQRFEGFSRRGKFLVFTLTDYILVAHLRMEGKFYVFTQHEEPYKHTHVVFTLDEGELHYNDVRKFGRFYLYRKDEEVTALDKLGYEPFDDQLSACWLKDFCRNRKTPIKSQLLDQSMIAGIGNIYANEICYEVSLDPLKPACFISLEKWDEIIAATRKILTRAIEAGGTTIRSYTSSLGVTGLFQLDLNVHGRNGQGCHECGSLIEKKAVNGRGTYFCPNCQKKRAVLAAVTGNIGSGKSTFTEMAEERGISVISCDAINRELVDEDETKARIAEILNCDKEIINRTYIAERIYADEEIRHQVEEYLHGRIWLKVEQFYLQHIDEDVVLVEVPLLFETDWYRRFDYNILVCSSREQLYRRLYETRGMSRQQVDTILSNQLDDSMKKELADSVIHNNGSLNNLRLCVEKELNHIVKC